MAKRNIIHIDRDKCNGCGQCVHACVEGAIAMIDGKAQLVSDTYCDGLGACIGKCPQDAITIEQRDAAEFDPQAVERHLKAQGKLPASELTAESLATVGESRPVEKPLPCGCPGSMSRVIERPISTKKAPTACACSGSSASPAATSELRNWPVQLTLAPINAPYFRGAALMISADCVAHALADFQRQFVAGRTLLIACPKLDDTDAYLEKLTAIIRDNDIRSIDVAYMEVPCCRGLVDLVMEAVDDSGKTLPIRLTQVGIDGEIRDVRELNGDGGCSCCG